MMLLSGDGAPSNDFPTIGVLDSEESGADCKSVGIRYCTQSPETPDEPLLITLPCPVAIGAVPFEPRCNKTALEFFSGIC